jgi:hypothetical protein
MGPNDVEHRLHFLKSEALEAASLELHVRGAAFRRCARDARFTASSFLQSRLADFAMPIFQAAEFPLRRICVPAMTALRTI